MFDFAKVTGKVFLSIAGVIILVVGLIMYAFSEPFFPEVLEQTFVSADGKTKVILQNKKRVRIGDETNIYIWVEVGDYKSEPKKSRS